MEAHRNRSLWKVGGFAAVSLLVACLTAGCSNEQAPSTSDAGAQKAQEIAALSTPAFRNLGKRGETNF